MLNLGDLFWVGKCRLNQTTGTLFRHKTNRQIIIRERQTSIDTIARNGNAPKSLNRNKFIVIEYKYLVTLVVI